MTAVWLTAAGQRTDLADSNRCEAEVRRARTRVSNGSRGAVRRLDRLGRKADVEVTRPAPDVRLLRQPANSSRSALRFTAVVDQCSPAGFGWPRSYEASSEA